MKRTATLVAAMLTAFAAQAQAPEKVKFPNDYLKGTLYDVLDRPDVKQQRYLFTQDSVIESVRKGKGIPSGAVLTLVQWSVHQDAGGNPLKDSDGRFIKNQVTGITVMEKRTGWGAEYPADFRNGEWEYQAFRPDGTPNPKANLKACFMCHLPHAKQDFVMSLAKLDGTFPAAQAAAKAPKGDVSIVSFAFMPATIGAAVGKALTFLNSDPSPHQIVVTGQPQKTGVLLRGQRASISFDKPGSYNYICGLHPTMKGVIDVK